MKYSKQLEIGFFNYRATIVEIDPGANWKGYNLDNKQNGLDVSVINGLIFREKMFSGIGLGYLNFEGISGLSLFTDFTYIPFNSKISPLFGVKIGYSHIWNQYRKGTGDILLESEVGIRYKLNEEVGIYLQSGILLTQQTSFLPIKLGIYF